jgi:hypothetical protein
MRGKLLITQIGYENNRDSLGGPIAKKKRTEKVSSDDRVTLKFDRYFWDLVTREIDNHPEWGVKSVPDFVRRAVDNELNTRKKSIDRKVIELRFKP